MHAGGIDERRSAIVAGPLASTWEERARVRRFARPTDGTALRSAMAPGNPDALQSHLTLSLSPQWRRGDPPMRPANGHVGPGPQT